MARYKLNSEQAAKLGKISSRKNIKNKKTKLTEYLLAKHNESKKNGTPLVTMEDLKKDSPVVWLWLRENAKTLQEVLLCESHLSKYLHTQKAEITLNSISELFKEDDKARTES